MSKFSGKRAYVALSAMVVAAFQPNNVLAACSSNDIRLEVRSSLAFGTIMPCGSQSGTVTVLAASGNRTTSGCISTVTGPALLGQIRVEPDQNDTGDEVVLSISVPPTVSNGTGRTMTASPIKLHDTNGGPSLTAPITLTGDARARYDVGGSLNVGANQGAGSYSGTVTILVTCK